MENKVISDFLEMGCTSKKETALAAQVYMELSEVKRYWDIEYKYTSRLDKIYFLAKKSQKSEPSYFVPIAASDDLSFNRMNHFIQLSDDKEKKSVLLVVVNPDSTSVFYQISEGLDYNPSPAKRMTTERLDADLEKFRAVIEHAGLTGTPITIPKGSA